MELHNALYLFPVAISDAPLADILPQGNITLMREIKYYIVENVRTARRFLKRCDPSINIGEITFFELNRHTDENEISGFLAPLREGNPIGVMSEAGCPGVADPGAAVVAIARNEGLDVVPLIGPSSILLALMASGFNGQRFCFQGYLPIEDKIRDKKIRELEEISRKADMTQIFIETPYRNQRLMDSLIKILHPSTRLCIAASLTDPEDERVVVAEVADWKKGLMKNSLTKNNSGKNNSGGNNLGINIREDFNKRPAIFLIYAR